MNYEERIAELAETFPTLEGAPLRPWNAEQFEKWAMNKGGSGLTHSAQFVLRVWSCNHAWKIGRFDALDAMFAWDARHREAFINWTQAPWIR